MILYGINEVSVYKFVIVVATWCSTLLVGMLKMYDLFKTARDSLAYEYVTQCHVRGALPHVLLRAHTENLPKAFDPLMGDLARYGRAQGSPCQPRQSL